MPPEPPSSFAKPRAFELRMSAIFFALFLPLGVHLPYFPLWLQAKGFGAEEIAVILSAPMFLRMATTPLITALADESRDRANVLVLLAVATLVVSCGYFLKATYLFVLAVSLLLAVAWAPQSPLADSLALSGVRRFGSVYARMRIWGSISFLVANLAGGALLSVMGAGAVVPIIVAGLLLTLLAVLASPRLGRPRKASLLSATELTEAGPKLLNRFFLLSVAGSGIVNGSHGFMYAFMSIYWQSIGIGETTVGLLWAWGVVSEVLMFLSFPRFFARVPSERVLVMAGLAAVLRWSVYPLVWPLGLGVPGFFFVQSLHAFSTALFLLGLQKLIAEHVAEERTGAAQGIAYFATGMATAAVTLASGPLYATFGANGYVAMIAVAIVGIGLILLAGSPPQRRLGR